VRIEIQEGVRKKWNLKRSPKGKTLILPTKGEKEKGGSAGIAINATLGLHEKLQEQRKKCYRDAKSLPGGSVRVSKDATIEFGLRAQPVEKGN